MRLVTTAEMKALEQAAVDGGTSLETLMDNAGLAVAQEVRRAHPAAGRALVLVGPGNNGGDGLVCAEHLRQWGWNVHLHLVPQRERDPHRFTVLQSVAPGPVPDQPVDMVIDALLGTGSSRPIGGPLAETVEAVRARHAGALVVAVDVPSGVNADTGAADPRTLPAAVTATLGVAKAGLYQYPAHELAGDIRVLDIGLPGLAVERVTTWLGEAALAAGYLPGRPRDAHKGTFGKLLVLAGAANYPGAPYLTSAAAMRAGAGLLRLATPRGGHGIVAGKLTEATFLPLPETGDGWLAITALAPLRELANAEDFDCLLIGPGLGRDPQTRGVVEEVLLGRSVRRPPRIVADADALNTLAEVPNWHQRLPRGCVLTPHPAEFGRLAALSTVEVLATRLALARDKAREWGQVIVAKGANTIIAGPDGRTVIDPGANPLVATAGTGDVLAGTIAGLLTQGAEPWEGAVAATRICSLAAARLTQTYGQAGMLASDLHAEIPRAMQALRYASG